MFPTYTLDKTQVISISQVDKLLDGVNNLVSGQIGKDYPLALVDHVIRKEISMSL